MLCAQRVFASILLTFCLTISAAAQSAWVQVEAQPSLAQAQERVRDYAQFLPDVNGFALGGGWYGVALGPYTRADAETALRSYRRDRLIPRDAFIAVSSNLRQQFWPVGANILDPAVAPAPVETETPNIVAEDVPEAEPTPVAQAEPAEPAGETPAEAQRSERALNREEKKDLQFYLFPPQQSKFVNLA